MNFNDNAEKIAEYLLSMEDVPYRTTKSFIWAVLGLFDKGTEKHREMIRENIIKIPRLNTVADYRAAFENIINYKRKNNFLKLN
jgi:hypothetical protein